jgi:tetratricopeptide (TPR) repeat protein
VTRLIRHIGLAALCATVLASAGSVQTPQAADGDATLVQRLGGNRLTFEAREGEEGLRFTIVAEKVPVDLVMGFAAQAMDRRLVGFEETARSALVDAQLEDRPAFEAIEAILGSVGLEARIQPGVLVIEETRPGQWSQPELLDQASAAYALAMRKHPSHALAPSARLAQGGIEEQRGNWDAALTHYEAVLEQFKSAPEAPRARMRSALTLERMGLWRDATKHLQILAHSNTSHDLGVDARFELARCSEELGDHERTLSVLAALDSHSPALEVADVTRRNLLAARASIGLNHHIDALRLLDHSERIGLTLEQRNMAHGLRALAFEGLELNGEASRCWLIFSREARGEDRALALENAARLAAIDGDDVGVLFVYEQAARDGLGARLLPFVRDARATLGLSPRLRNVESPENRLDVGIHRVSIGEYESALALLEPLFEDREALFPTIRIGVALALSDALDGAQGVEQALTVLRTAREETLDSEEHAVLDQHAAVLLEKHERFDEAVEAYRGNF